MTELQDFGVHAPAPGPQGSPFVSVWLKPGSTIKQIAATRPMRLYYPLAAIWGASYNLSLTIRRGVSAEELAKAGIASPWMIIAVNLVFGAVFGVAVLWLLSVFLARIGRLLGGIGRPREVLTVLAWSSVPHILNLALAMVVLLIGGTAVLTASHPRGTPVSSHPLQVIFLLSTSVLGAWGFVISVAGMKAVMGFSTLRAIGVYLIGGFIIVALILAIMGFSHS